VGLETPKKLVDSSAIIMALTAARSELLRSQLAPLSSSKPRRAKPAAAKEAAPARGWFRRGK
jgi:hypothetical protein